MAIEMGKLVFVAHCVAALFSLVELVLMSYAASVSNSTVFGTRSPDIVNFMIFNSIWSLLVLAYISLIPIYAVKMFHKLVSVGLLILTVIFWFSGAIALAVFTGTPRCNNSWCSSVQASVAFGFFLWAIFTFLAVLDSLAAWREREGNHHAPKTVGGHTYPGA